MLLKSRRLTLNLMMILMLNLRLTQILTRLLDCHYL
jgi:hypothetical protein